MRDRGGFPRAPLVALATFTASWDVGAVLGATALGVVADAAGYPLVFVMAGGLAAVMTAAYPVAVRRGPPLVPAALAP